MVGVKYIWVTFDIVVFFWEVLQFSRKDGIQNVTNSMAMILFHPHLL